MYPAKYTFSISGPPSCSDYAVFPANAAGNGTAATGRVTIATDPAGWVSPATTVTIAGVLYTFVTTTPAAANQVFMHTSGNSNTDRDDTAHNLNAVINNDSALCTDAGCVYSGQTANPSVTSTFAGGGGSRGRVNLTALVPGTAGNSLSLTTDNATNIGLVAFSGGTNGTQGNLVGITNLYSGTLPTGYCGTAPTIKFSYYVGNGTAATSPSLSQDGTQIAYVESVSGGSRFHVLTIGTTGSNGTSATAPAQPGSGNNATDTAITMNGGVQVTLSSPYVDYSQDFAYVGDDTGKLHKFTGVFNGTLAEVTTGGWPITVSTSASPILTGPTLDFNTGNVFVGDGSGVLKYVQTVAGGGCATPPCVGATTVNVGAVNGYGTPSGRAIIDPPVVDASTGHVFAFIGCGLSATNNSACTASTTSPFSYAYVMQASYIVGKSCLDSGGQRLGYQQYAHRGL